jgi:hypothetical protein
MDGSAHAQSKNVHYTPVKGKKIVQRIMRKSTEHVLQKTTGRASFFACFLVLK